MYAARAARLNEKLKKARLDLSASQGPGPSTSVPSVDDDSVSHELVEVTVETGAGSGSEQRESENESESESGRESESDNERQRDSASSDSESDFNDDAAQNCFDDFMVSLPSLARKTLSVSLMQYFQQRLGMNVKDSAQEAAFITGFNKKTVHTYTADFCANKGTFTESKRGRYERFCLFNDENIHLEASM